MVWFPAKLRTCDEDAANPIARVTLDRNPSGWWVNYEAYMQGLLTPEAAVAPVKKKKKKLVASTTNGEQ